MPQETQTQQPQHTQQNPQYHLVPFKPPGGLRKTAISSNPPTNREECTEAHNILRENLLWIRFILLILKKSSTHKIGYEIPNDLYPGILEFDLHHHFTTIDCAILKKRPSFFSKIKNSASVSIHTVIEAILRGDEAFAKHLIAANPYYLLQKGTGTDYSGRTIINVTPFQAALCAGDVEMCEMMKPYFDQLENGQEIMHQQIHEIFPDGLGAHLKKQEENTFDFSALVDAINHVSDEDPDLKAALNKEDNGSPLCQALNHFRDTFKQHALNEKIFNPQDLLRAFQLREEHYDDLTLNKCKLFCRQVIGYVERFLPACYAQAFAQGIYFVVNKKETLWRSFEDRGNRGRFVYPLDVISTRRLGFDYGGGAGYDEMVFCAWLIENLCRAKKSSLEILCMDQQSHYVAHVPSLHL